MGLKYSPELIFSLFILRKHINTSWTMTREFSYNINDIGILQFPHFKHTEIIFCDLLLIMWISFWCIKHSLKSESSMKFWFYWCRFLGLHDLLLVCKGQLRYINMQYLAFLSLLGFWQKQASLPGYELFILVASAFCCYCPRNRLYRLQERWLSTAINLWELCVLRQSHCGHG